MAFNPYDLYNQDPRNQVLGAGSVPYQTQSKVFDDSDQRQRTADLLRQGYQTPQAGKSTAPNFGDLQMAQMIAKNLGTDGASGAGGDFSSSEINAILGKVSPKFQNMNVDFNQLTPNQAAITPSSLIQKGEFTQPDLSGFFSNLPNLFNFGG